MNININGLSWNVKGVEKSALDENDERIFGMTYFDKLEICIDKSLPICLLKRTVIHELTHATLFSFGFIGDLLNEEMLCNFVETHIEFICNNSTKILEGLMDESN